MAQEKIDPRILERMQRELGEATPTSIASPTTGVPETGVDGFNALELPLLLGSLVGLIPTPLTRGVGGVSSAGLGLLQARKAVKSGQRGEYGKAALEGLFAGLSGAGSLALISRLRGVMGGGSKVLAAAEEKAVQLAKLEEEASRVKGAMAKANAKTIRQTKVQLAAEVRRALRESRLAARALTRAGKPVPKELEERIVRASELAEQQGIKLAASGPKPKAALPKAAVETKTVGSTATPEAQRLASTVEELLVKTEQPDVVKLVERMKTTLAKPPRSRKQKRAMDELGASVGEVLLRMSGALGGAAVGGAAGVAARPEDSERSKLTYGLAGAAAGALAGNALTAMATLRKGTRLEKLQDFNFFSLLSSPGTIGRVGFGGLGAILTTMAQKIGEGNYVAAARGIKTLLDPQTTTLMLKVAKDPWLYLPHALRVKGKVPLKHGVLGYPTRAIAAIDAASTRVMMNMGLSRADAMRQNLSGVPASEPGQEFLRAVGVQVGKKRPPKWTRTELGQLAARYLLPFPRVAVMGVEKAIEYSPLQAMKSVRDTFNSNPSSSREAITKAVLGPVVGGGVGAITAASSEPDVDPFTVALGGPLALWTGAGVAAVRGMGRDRPTMSTINKVLSDLPLMAEQVSALDPAKRAVPSIFSSIARAEDPAFGRESGPGALDQMLRQRADGEIDPLTEVGGTVLGTMASRFPILRESLPEAYMPVDVFGKAQYTNRPKYLPDITLRGYGSGPGWKEVVSVTWPKVLTSVPIENPPIFPSDNPTAQTVRKLQRETPSMPNLLAPPQVSVPPAVQEVLSLQDKPARLHREVVGKGQRARGKTVELALQQVVNTPNFQAMPKDIQSMVLRRVIETARDATEGVGELAGASLMSPDAQLKAREALRQWVAQLEGGR